MDTSNIFKIISIINSATRGSIQRIIGDRAGASSDINTITITTFTFTITTITINLYNCNN